MATTYTGGTTEQAGYNADDGLVIGKASTDKVAFFGGTPTARPSVTWPNTGTATTTLNELKANRIMAALVSLGLIATT